MPLKIELKARVLSCRPYERQNKRRYFINLLHKDEAGAETIFPTTSDLEVRPTPDEVDLVLEVASYKKAEGFIDKQTGQARAYQKDVPTFRLVG